MADVIEEVPSGEEADFEDDRNENEGNVIYKSYLSPPSS